MEQEIENVIDVHNLTKCFGNRVAVDHIDLVVKKGEIYGFLGPNGSGKTTTIRMICGLLTPDEGYGYCLGFDILKDSDAIKRQVGYMSQKFTLYEDLSIYENLQFIATVYGLTNADQRIRNTLNEIGLMERRNQLAGHLSGGWKQRLALGAALLHEPKLLLLDEPTAGVDPKARREFWDHIHFLSHRGITTLVSTHYMDEAERCNTLAYIMKGRILIRGTAESIISQSNLTTWEVKGNNLPLLAEQLKCETGVDQVISYGQTLHVSGKDQNLLQSVAEKFAKNHKWKLIATSLEDVFVSLVEPETNEVNEDG